jgi:hypothetical protein
MYKTIDTLGDKFTNDNKIDSSYTKLDQSKVKREATLNCLKELYYQINSGIITVDECVIEKENDKYYFGIKLSPVAY